MRRTQALAAVAKRSYWREGDARQIVDAWQSSGQPLTGFARRLGVDWRRVSRWATRLGQAEATGLRFHPVRVLDAPTPGPGAGSIDIEVGQGRRVRVAPGFAADDLRRVLAVLDESRPC